MAAEVGQKAPDFELFDANKQPTKLSDSKGKNVVLAFYPGAFTGVCTTEMCTFRDRFDSFNSMNAQVFGISVDVFFSQKVFSDTNNLNFPLLSDYTRETVNAYGTALPNFAGMEGYTASQRAVFVIDKEGVIRFKWVGENPGVEPDYDEIQRQVDQLN
ncbi:MAG: peroxiredoxin [SAR202 cluster bacterium]|jgi:peroxiredoxin|nr:peroxiredoxin [Chloroflexota bacterium]MCS5654860.1 peroxiredoxin [Dehalococcoidia bacterium]MQG48927.1 peroxiredoxin [SAR202 cluster bacterium]PKB74659.1 MAG: peroxiredoxin [SAR202 cluster bacterium Io17-Chloro-G8]MAQ54955.1 peroxiredoxin [Chloroflexota bacterium]|tara:strand:+ start:878 stop:1351 length:474 start_codon:yes stop_codon:yes gene_type:complete